MPSLGYFTIIFLAVTVAIIALAFGLALAFQIELPTAVSTIVPPMIAAMMTGQRFAKATGQVPDNDIAGPFATRATGIVFGISFLFAGLFYGLDPIMRAELTPVLRSGVGLAILLGMLVLLVVVVYFLIRTFLKSGAKQIVRASK